jgi:pimeloyl-ACP methyl ester carboxylesterase
LKTLKRILVVLFAIAVLGALGLTLWGNNAYPPLQPALDALISDPQVTVTQHDGFITFEPVSVTPTTGLVFVPGGRVDYRVYAPVLKQIAAQGYFVAVVKVTINLAFFDINAPERVISQYPNIQHWAVGGHSLGGVAASSYVSQHLDTLDGVVFWASYPSSDALKDASLKALLVYGTNDLVGSTAYTDETLLGNFPADTQIVAIEGGNHAQFGSYGPQAGDKAATISAEEQWAQAAAATVQFLESLGK